MRQTASVVKGPSHALAANSADEIASEVVPSSAAEERAAHLSRWVGELAGRRNFVAAMTCLADVADLERIRELKERKAYRGTFPRSDGTLVNVSSFEAFCREVLERDRAAVDRELQNLHVLGATLMAALQGIGLPVRKLSALRSSATDVDRRKLLELAQQGDAQVVADEVEAILARQRAEHEAETQEKDKAIKLGQQKVDEQRKRLETKERRLQASGDRVHELEQQIDELRKRIEPPDGEIDAIKLATQLMEKWSSLVNETVKAAQRIAECTPPENGKKKAAESERRIPYADPVRLLGRALIFHADRMLQSAARNAGFDLAAPGAGVEAAMKQLQSHGAHAALSGSQGS